jgi:hypothetical protein
LDSLQLADALEGSWDFFEVVSAQTDQPEGAPCEQGPVWTVAKSAGWAGWHSLCRSKSLKSVPVVTEEPIGGGYPQKSCMVLVDGPHRQVVQAFRNPEIPEAGFLCAERSAH